jgi:hypothetical protein
LGLQAGDENKITKEQAYLSILLPWRLGAGYGGRPLSFRGKPLMIEKYDGFTKPSMVEMFHFEIFSIKSSKLCPLQRNVQ